MVHDEHSFTQTKGSDLTLGHDQRIYLLTRVAHMYYDQNATQEAIAAALNLSRPTVSRLLKEAREEGVVQIRIHSPFAFVMELETALAEGFPHLRAARVVRSADLTGVARAAAAVVGNTVRDGDMIGVAWGRAVAAVAEHLAPQPLKGATVVQLSGGVAGAAGETGAHDTVHRFGRAFGAPVHYLNVPAIVDAPHVSAALRQNRETAGVLELGRRATVAVCGIGVLDAESALVQAGYICPEHLAGLRAKGAVGHTCSRYFTAEGRVCDPELDGRTVSLALEHLPGVEHSIGVVYGTHKAAAVLGALNGRLFNTLVIDEATARAVLRHYQEGLSHHD